MRNVNSSLLMHEFGSRLIRNPARSHCRPLVGITLVLLMSVLTICGCCTTSDVRVGGISLYDPLPATRLVEYTEQMRYLAMRAEPAERAKRLDRLAAIERRIQDAVALMEQYRKDFGFRKCGSRE